MSAIEKATANASPRPWRVDAFEGMDLLCSADGHTVAGMHAHNDKPNSALILQAVNQFDALLEVEKASMAYWKSTTGQKKDCGHDFSCICAGDRIRAAFTALSALREKESA